MHKTNTPSEKWVGYMPLVQDLYILLFRKNIPLLIYVQHTHCDTMGRRYTTIYGYIPLFHKRIPLPIYMHMSYGMWEDEPVVQYYGYYTFSRNTFC